MRLKLLKKIVMFMDMMQYQYVWHKTGSKHFQSGNFYVKDASRSDRPITGKVDEIMEKVEQDRYISSHDIGKKLNIDHKTVLKHLEKAGYKKTSIFECHSDLTVKNLMERIIPSANYCLKRNKIEHFWNDSLWAMKKDHVRQ